MNSWGKYCWAGTIDEFLKLTRDKFMLAMKVGTRARLKEGETLELGQIRAWKDERKHLFVQLSKLPLKYRGLHIVFEYVLPGHPDKLTEQVAYCKVPDAMVIGRSGVLVLEFKQREPPPYDGFAKETRSYLRLLEKWHPLVPKMSAHGALVLTKAVEFRKSYPRVKAISPDRICSCVKKTFCDNPTPYSSPDEFLSAIKTPERSLDF